MIGFFPSLKKDLSRYFSLRKKLRIVALVLPGANGEAG